MRIISNLVNYDGLDVTNVFDSYVELKQKNFNVIKVFREVGLDEVADKISICHKDSVFRKCNNCGTYHFINTKTCKKRFCYICSKKRYLAYVAKYMPIFQELMDRGKKVLFVTFTLKNMPNLEEMLNRFNTTFKKFREKYSIYYNFVEGAIVSREITNIGNGWHVHFHTLLIMNDDYNFKDREYQRLLRDSWQEKTKDSWSIDVRSVKGESLIKAVCETFKYMTKLKMLDSSFLRELYETTYKRRLVSTVGIMFGLVNEEEIEKSLEEKDLRDLENLICAVCGESATNSVIEYYDSEVFYSTGENVYSFKSRA